MIRNPKDHAFTVRITGEDRTLLEELARQEDIPAAAILRRALRGYLEHAFTKAKAKRPHRS